MATTENTYTGDGTTVLYNFTFPYIDETDVYVSLDGTATTAYSYANATTIQFTTAPASGVAIKIYRATSSADTKAAFFAGSAIRSKDLNDNFTQSLYIAQESENVADAAKTQAATAEASAATANQNATAAAASAATATQQATASAASSASALAASQQASTDAAAAQASSTASAASSAQAASDAAQAATDSATAVTTAQGAVTTANSASTLATTADGNATTSLNRVNTYLHDGTNPVGDGVGSNPQGLLYAINQAQSAVSDSASAVSTANAATASASSAVTTANAASATATAASNAVAAAAFYSPYAALANLPGSPSDDDRAEVANSTGVESSSLVSGVPSGFVGATDLTVRLQYDSATSKWEWQNYFASDPDNRYLTESSPVVKGDSTNGSGEITLNCENNSHGVTIKGPAHSAAATYTLTLPDDTGTAGQLLTTDGSGGNLSWVTNQNNEITGGNNASVQISLNSLNQDQLQTTLQNVLLRRDYHTHSFVYTRQLFSEDMELRGNKTFRFNNSGGVGAYTGFKKSTTATTSVDFTLPDADGTAGQAIVTDGSGVLSFADAGAPTIDGGNFRTGGSLVTTSNTFDGGHF